MEFKIYNQYSMAEYLDYLEDHPFSGIWHDPKWLTFQLQSNKAKAGYFFSIRENDKILGAGLLLIQVKTRFIPYGYIPGGILWNKVTPEIYAFLNRQLRQIAQKNQLIFIQVDSVSPDRSDFRKIVENYQDHQINVKLPIPQWTNIIDLKQSEDEILAGMKKKGRYNTKLALKKGVVIREGKIEDVKQFYQLLKITTRRDGFSSNGLDYYQKMMLTIPFTRLLLAFHEQDLIAGGIFSFTRKQALYYYGASANIKRNLMAPYLIQWQAIKIGKLKGCQYYDFMGIAPPDQPEDPLSGVTDFKLKFGGKKVQFSPSYQIILKPLFFCFYQNALKLKRKLRR